MSDAEERIPIKPSLLLNHVELLRGARGDGDGRAEVSANVITIGGDREPRMRGQIGRCQHEIGSVGCSAGSADGDVPSGQHRAGNGRSGRLPRHYADRAAA